MTEHTLLTAAIGALAPLVGEPFDLERSLLLDRLLEALEGGWA